VFAFITPYGIAALADGATQFDAQGCTFIRSFNRAAWRCSRFRLKRASGFAMQRRDCTAGFPGLTGVVNVLADTAEI
jgi:hypothetical protein